MNVFVLTTGRSGSTTFARACAHLTNYSSAHESQSAQLLNRCVYPDDHIEVDNRLAWFLGTLDRLYGNRALYVYLKRDPDEVAASYAVRFRGKASLVHAFGQGIIQRTSIPDAGDARRRIARVCVDTINDNIQAFLKDKAHVVHASLPNLEPGFMEMCRQLDAEGDMDAARAELKVRHNARKKRRRS